MAGSTWNDSSDKDLLLAIIARGDLKSINWYDVCESMTSLGYTFSHEACRQHYQKLRRQRAVAHGVEGPAKVAANSPSKRKQPTKEKAPTSGKSTKLSKSAAAKPFSGDDDEGFEETPSKRIKSFKVEPRVLNGPQFKMEEDYEENIEHDGSFNGFRKTRVIDLENDDLY